MTADTIEPTVEEIEAAASAMTGDEFWGRATLGDRLRWRRKAFVALVAAAKVRAQQERGR